MKLFTRYHRVFFLQLSTGRLSHTDKYSMSCIFQRMYLCDDVNDPWFLSFQLPFHDLRHSLFYLVFEAAVGAVSLHTVGLHGSGVSHHIKSDQYTQKHRLFYSGLLVTARHCVVLPEMITSKLTRSEYQLSWHHQQLSMIAGYRSHPFPPKTHL